MLLSPLGSCAYHALAKLQSAEVAEPGLSPQSPRSSPHKPFPRLSTPVSPGNAQESSFYAGKFSYSGIRVPGHLGNLPQNFSATPFLVWLFLELQSLLPFVAS